MIFLFYFTNKHVRLGKHTSSVHVIPEASKSDALSPANQRTLSNFILMDDSSENSRILSAGIHS